MRALSLRNFKILLIGLCVLMVASCNSSTSIPDADGPEQADKAILPSSTPTNNPINSEIDTADAEETEEPEEVSSPEKTLELDVTLFGVEECHEDELHYLWVWIRVENTGENQVQSLQLLRSQFQRDLKEEGAISTLDTLDPIPQKEFHDEQQYCNMSFEAGPPIISSQENLAIDLSDDPYANWENWDPDEKAPSVFLQPDQVGYFSIQYSLANIDTKLIKFRPYYKFCSEFSLEGHCIDGSFLVEYLLENTEYVNELKFYTRGVKNANCRAGPSQEYNETGFLPQDEFAIAIGRSENSSWVLLQLGEDLRCWVFGQSLDLSPWNTGYLPIKRSTARRIPTPEPEQEAPSAPNTEEDDQPEIEAIAVGHVCEIIGITLVQACFETCPDGWTDTGETCTP